MNPAHFTVRRPVFTTMATLIVVILGGISLMRLPVDLMPDITYPTLSVSTRYENASPEEMEELVTRPLEEALSAVPGVEEITSTSTEGLSSLRISFVWGTDLDVAANDIRDRLDRVVRRLPDDAERPVLRKFDLASFPVMIMGAAGDLDPVQLRQMIEQQVKYRLERVPGVASLDIWGGLEREIHVDLDIDRVRAYELSLSQVLTRIRHGNLERPAGTVREGHLDLRIRVPGYFADIDELRDTVIIHRAGAPVKLGDIAVVRDAWEKPTRLVRVNGRPGVRLALNKQSGVNTVSVARGAHAELERINRDLPQINIIPIVDSSVYIRRSMRNLGMVAGFGGILAVLVLLFFLRDIRSTLVVAAAIPVSMVATFAMMYFNGYTLNIMTLGGLALGVGMLVDNSIVVLENVVRLRSGGRPTVAAAVEGAGEVTAPIIASTLTTIVVFLPLIFVQGMAGVMFKQLAMVVSFSLLCSLVTAVTLVPMLAARWLGNGAGPAPSLRLADAVASVGRRSISGYMRILQAALAHKGAVIGAALLMMAVTVAMAPLVGTELMPETDEGELRIQGEMETGTRMEVVSEAFLEMERIVRAATPEIESMVVSMGGSPWRGSGTHTANMRISLKPLRARQRSSEEIAADLRRRLAHIPGVTVRVRMGQGLFIMRMAAGDGERVAVEVRGHDLETADALAARVDEIVRHTAGVTDTRISRETGLPERRVVIDRAKAADLGLTVENVATALEIVLGGISAGYFREEGNEYRILLKSTRAEFMLLDEVLDLTVINQTGQAVILRNVVSVHPAVGPALIERRNQERVVNVSGNIAGRDLGSIVADVREQLRGVAIPRGFDIVFAGDYEEQQKAFRELLFSLLLAIVLVYMVMACQFESLRDPLVVIFSVPLAALGVVVMLVLTGTTMNVQSFIGCIMLAGIVVNNAILLVDHANLLRRRDGLSLYRAIEESGRRRLRPICMTAMTTSLGLAPMALGLGEGGEAQAPMARAVIGGILSATLVTLVLIPVVYMILEKKMSPHRPPEGG